MRIVKTAEERKNEILDVAEELFAEKGYDNASTNDIIARIGIARGTLYHHFGSKEEVMDQMHKPQNALLHQKMQERLISGVVPLIAQLIDEGIESGIFDTKYPNEAAEMIMIYGNIAFDDNENLTPKQKKQKGKAFIYNIEKMLGAKQGSLEKALIQFF